MCVAREKRLQNNESFSSRLYYKKVHMTYRYFYARKNRAHIKMNTTIKNVSLVIYRDE